MITIDGQRYDRLTLSVSTYGGVDVHGWSTYKRGSVLEGQPMKVFIDALECEEFARAKYPQLQEGFSSKWTEPQVCLSHLPDENDPVPGGMWPDDYDADRYDVGDWSR